eukprot:5315127-Prymnesium_polylepis.1
MVWEGTEIDGDDLKTAAEATAGNTVAGEPSEDVLELARKLVRSGEKILAVYEPEGSSYRTANQQQFFDTCICPWYPLFCCVCIGALFCFEECRGHDDSYFVVTDKAVYKQPRRVFKSVFIGKHKQGRVEFQE